MTFYNFLFYIENMKKNRILVKLIDEAILPAFLIFSVKIISLLGLIKLFNLNFSLNTQTLLPFLSFESQKDLVFVNSYSNFLMFLAVVIGLLVVLARAHFTHDTHIHPELTLKLFTLNLEGLMVSSFEIYHQAVVWLLFLWFSILIFVLQALAGISPAILAVFALSLGIILTGLLIMDVESEVQHENFV